MKASPRLKEATKHVGILRSAKHKQLSDSILLQTHKELKFSKPFVCSNLQSRMTYCNPCNQENPGTIVQAVNLLCVPIYKIERLIVIHVIKTIPGL